MSFLQLFPLYLAFLAVSIVVFVCWRQREALKRLEQALAKAVQGQSTLETEFSNLALLADPISYAYVHVTDPKDRGDALHEMRSCCSHGIDQAFAADIASGLFAIITIGKMDPRSVADYFFSELGARGILCRIGWAYTESTTREDRSLLPSVASKALEGVTEIGFRVEIVNEDNRTLKGGKIITDLRAERENWGLTRADVAPIVGLSPPRLRDIEIGRACDSAESSRLTAFFGALSFARASATTANRQEEPTK